MATAITSSVEARRARSGWGVLSVPMGAAAGAAWLLPWPYGPLGSILLVLAIGLAGTGRRRHAAAMAYFLAGSSGLPQGAATFFGSGHPVLGALLWIGSAVALAAPWIWAGSWKGVLAALLLDAVPPLGLFGWLSPLTAVGLLYPGTSLIGLVLILLLYALTASGRLAAAGGLVLVAIFANAVYAPPTMPEGWIGVSTNAGLVPLDPLAGIMRNGRLLGDVTKQAGHAGVVVLPETVVGTWLPGTANQVKASVPTGRTWLVGTSIWEDGERWDALIPVYGGSGDSMGSGKEGAAFRAALPVPVSMWHPWRPGGYGAAWWEPVRVIDGRRVFASICYDQLLPWVWLEALLQRPGIVVAVSNVWWAKGTSIPGIERATSEAWGRLMGVPMVVAINQ